MNAISPLPPAQPIKLSANENPLGPSPKVVAAMQEAATHINRYPAYMDTKLREALAAHHGRGLSAENFYVGHGGVEVIEFIYRGLLKPGDNVIVCPPTFRLYFRFGRQYAVDIRSVPLLTPDFTLDVDGVLAAIDERTRLIVIINPNNPTGTLIGRESYQRLIDNLPVHVTLIADEVYHNFVDSADYPDTISFIQSGHNIIRIHSFSKAFAMGGMRLGYGLASVDMAARLRAFQRPFHINQISTAGALAALTDDDFVTASIANNSAGARYLYVELDKLGGRYWETQTNFMMIETALPAAELTTRLEQAGILVRDLRDALLPNCVRVTIGLPHENQAFIEALRPILT